MPAPAKARDLVRTACTPSLCSTMGSTLSGRVDVRILVSGMLQRWKMVQSYFHLWLADPALPSLNFLMECM